MQTEGFIKIQTTMTILNKYRKVIKEYFHLFNYFHLEILRYINVKYLAFTCHCHYTLLKACCLRMLLLTVLSVAAVSVSCCCAWLEVKEGPRVRLPHTTPSSCGSALTPCTTIV